MRKGDNEVKVRLENMPESSRWYPGAGLYRQVHLISTDDNHIAIWGTRIRTMSLKGNKAEMNIEGTVLKKQKATVTVNTEIYYADKLVFQQSQKIKVKATECKFASVFMVDDAHCWSPEDPQLYTARYTVFKGKKEVDRYEEQFGIRTIEIRPDDGFYLNGAKRKFKGVCLHHDLGPLGAAAYRDGIKHQLLMLQDMGCDAIRTSHNMPAPELVDLCDSLGFMMMVEPFDEWEWGKCKNGYNRFFEKTDDRYRQQEKGQSYIEGRSWAEKDMVNMLRHYRNHPSVVMWSIGNEVPTQCAPEGYKVAKFLQDICTREDGTRPVTCGMDGVDCVLENGFAQVMQVVGINYRAHRYEEVYGATPQKLVLGSETASAVSSRGVYKLPAKKDDNSLICNVPQPNGDSKKNQCSSYDLEYCPWSNIPDDDFRNMDDFPWTIGQFVWTGFDYLGEPSPWDTDAWPSHSSYFGIIDLASIPKDRYYLYRSVWNTTSHTLHILPHWNWESGQAVPVMVYTDYDEAELFLNGRSLGRQKKLTREEAKNDDRWGWIRCYRLIWDDVAFEAGELKVVAYDSEGKAVMSSTRRTAGRPARVAAIADRCGELTYVRIRVLDDTDTLCPLADDHIGLSFEGGEGKILGSANGDAACLIPFQSMEQQVFNGEMTCIVKGSGKLRIEDTDTGAKTEINL